MQLKTMLLVTAVAAAIIVGAQTPRVGEIRAANPASSPACRAEKINVIAASADESAAICRGAQSAFDALGKCGLRLPHPVKIETRHSLMSVDEPQRWGDFTPSRRLIRLASRAQREQAIPPLFFGTSLSAQEHYAGVAAHEIAHAVFAQTVSAHNMVSLDLPATAHEYVAYVVQMMSFSEDTRRRILARDPPKTVSNLFVFSFFLLYADPERFAVNAYAHFALPENGCAFIGRILRGEVHFPPASD